RMQLISTAVVVSKVMRLVFWEHAVKIASIILCAGVGSRLKSSKSKILHEVCGRPLGYWPIKNAMAATNLKPIVVLSHQAEVVEDRLKGYFHDTISFAYQKVPDGT